MFARKSRAPQPSQRPTKPPSLQPAGSEVSVSPREQIAALHIDAIGALNSVIGLSSLLAGDGRGDEREAGRAQRYGKHIRAAGEVLQGIVGRMVAVTSDAFDSGPASLDGAPVHGPCSSPRLKVLPVRPPEPLDEFERLSVTPAADLSAPLPRVLVVDADPGGRELLRAYLHGRPYEVLLATSAQEALLLAAVTPPDLVLLDAMLPNHGANVAARRLKESAHGEYLPIIFMTAYGDGDAPHRGARRRCGAVPREAAERARGALARRQPPDAAGRAQRADRPEQPSPAPAGVQGGDHRAHHPRPQGAALGHHHQPRGGAAAARRDRARPARPTRG